MTDEEIDDNDEEIAPTLFLDFLEKIGTEERQKIIDWALSNNQFVLSEVIQKAECIAQINKAMLGNLRKPKF